jgi:WD40 repeat protein/Tfp pilus assembly protein PilF
MRVYDLQTGNEEQRFKVGPWGHDFAWHPEGRQLAVSQRTGVQLWDLHTGQVQRTLLEGEFTNSVAWHPGGRFLAIGAGPVGEQHIKVYDVVANRLQSDVRVPTPSTSVPGFSPSGDVLFSTGNDETIRLWDPLTGRQHVALEGAEILGRTMGFSRDGRLLACTKTGTKVIVWEVARTDVEWNVVGPTSSAGVRAVNFSPDGRLLLLGMRQRLYIWDRAAGREVASLPVDGAAQFHPNGDSILSDGDPGLLRWPVAREPAAPGQVRRLRIGPPEFLTNPGYHASLSLTTDGRVLAAVDGAGQCGVILHLHDKARKVTTGTHRGMDWCALSHDGRRLVTGVRWRDGKRVAKVWDAWTGRWECDLETGDAIPLFSPDGRWLVTSTSQREFRFWKPGSWESRHAVPRQGDLSGAMAFTPDGGLLAIARTRTLVQLIDPDTGVELADLEVPDADSISSLAFNRDGTLLAAARANQVVHVWDLRRLRSWLAKFGLDWDPLYQPAPDAGTDTPRPSTPIQVTVDAGDLPKKTEANRLFAQAGGLASAKEYVRAVDLLRQAIRTDAKHALAHNHLAWILLTGPKDLRDPKEALLLARKAVELTPERPPNPITLGVALYRNDQFAEAALVLEKSLTENEGANDAIALWILAMCHHRLGNHAKAKDCLDRAERWFKERRSQFATRYVPELTEFEAEARSLLRTP